MSSTVPLRPHTKWSFAMLFGVLGGVVVGVLLLAFVWPAATAKAQHLPVAIDGPAVQVTALEKAIRAESTDPFTFVSVDSRATAVHRIRTRAIYGAILLGDSPEVLTSSAGSSVANQILRSVAVNLQAQITAGTEKALEAKLAQLSAALAHPSAKPPSGGAATQSGAAMASAAPPQVTITDVVALSSADPTGAGLNSASFPLVLGGVLGGVIMSLLVVGVIRRLLGLVIYALIAGAGAALIMQTWLKVLQGDWLLTAAAFGLAMLATAALVVGLNALLGTPGIGVGSIITLLIGNPLSGATIPYQFIASPWGDVGQFFVAGASANLVRSLSYFPEADTAKQWIVIGAWAVGGVLLAIVGHFRSAAPIPLPARELASKPAHRAGDPVVAH